MSETDCGVNAVFNDISNGVNEPGKFQFVGVSGFKYVLTEMKAEL